MPAVRSNTNVSVVSTSPDAASTKSKYFKFDVEKHRATIHSGGNAQNVACTGKQSESTPKHGLKFPARDDERDAYRSPSGKKLTTHQWKVYDFTLTIPRGKVATYKDVAEAVGGSPRSVGNALRNNPFAPYVPCHRVIASSHFVGGFLGEWGKEHKSGTQYNRKLELLSTEGISFDAKGYLLAKDNLMHST